MTVMEAATYFPNAPTPHRRLSRLGASGLFLRCAHSLLYQPPAIDPIAIGGSVILLLAAAAVAAISRHGMQLPSIQCKHSGSSRKHSEISLPENSWTFQARCQ